MRNGKTPHLFLSLLCFVLPAQAELETDVVVPRLLSGEEAHLSPQRTVHSARRRGLRSLDAPEGGHPDNILLSLPAFGRDLYLNLTRDNTFLSEDFVVEERHRDRIAAVSSLSTSQVCFYTGSIVNRTDSAASISTCGGLTGLVHIGEERLFIQPVGGNDPTQTFTRLKHRLLRYRRSAKRSSYPHADQPNHCEIVQGKKKEKRSKVGEEGRGKRNGIRLHNSYTVETVVVADSDMVQYHGAEAAQRFLLTVMNMVYNMFHHQSLGVRINIRVTKLVLLHSRPEKLKVGHYGERSLESFCHWQYQEFGGARYLGTNHVPGGKDDIPPVDTAVLVTRWLPQLAQRDPSRSTLPAVQRDSSRMTKQVLLCFPYWWGLRLTRGPPLLCFSLWLVPRGATLPSTPAPCQTFHLAPGMEGFLWPKPRLFLPLANSQKGSAALYKKLQITSIF